jgi:hypothetical protein
MSTLNQHTIKTLEQYWSKVMVSCVFVHCPEKVDAGDVVMLHEFVSRDSTDSS